jgi:gamma-glutamylcyclotransferase (GGCT)/AIG2-like uncharacterized protein YtfP
MSDKYNFPVKVFVFGTLRKGQRLDYYMDGSVFEGLYYTEGQLMKSEIGNAYIDFSKKGVATKGELYHMSFPGLLRINHLESRSGEFPKAYDLDLIPIWKYHSDLFTFNLQNCSYALVYKLRNEPRPIPSGDWTIQFDPLNEIQKFLNQNKKDEIDSEKLINYLLSCIKK